MRQPLWFDVGPAPHKGGGPCGEICCRKDATDGTNKSRPYRISLLLGFLPNRTSRQGAQAEMQRVPFFAGLNSLLASLTHVSSFQTQPERLRAPSAWRASTTLSASCAEGDAIMTLFTLQAAGRGRVCMQAHVSVAPRPVWAVGTWLRLGKAA